jgi:RHS repeat-associated protein
VIVPGQSFDAFGLRRHDDYLALTLTQLRAFNTTFTTRGFTGHEWLDPVGLVHMNGRVYDPKRGRFVSGDPFVQDPASTQSHNRYSYVLNIPLAYTNPSWCFFESLGGFIIGSIIASILKQNRMRIVFSTGLARGHARPGRHLVEQRIALRPWAPHKGRAITS